MNDDDTPVVFSNIGEDSPGLKAADKANPEIGDETSPLGSDSEGPVDVDSLIAAVGGRPDDPEEPRELGDDGL